MLALSSAINAGSILQRSERGLLPNTSDVNEGIFSEYYFDITKGKEVKDLMHIFPSQAVVLDESKRDVFIGLGMASCLDGKCERDDSNILVLLDISGSMQSCLPPVPSDNDDDDDDNFGGGGGSGIAHDSIGDGVGIKAERKSQLSIAKDVIKQIIDILRPGDRFGLILFDDSTDIIQKMQPTSELNKSELKKQIDGFCTRGSTDMYNGIACSIKEMETVIGKDQKNNRIIIITDACPNIFGKETEKQLGERAAEKGIYLTYIGVGIDFNTKLVNELIKVKGTNYFSVKSERDFHKILSKEFNYIVTPICFDLSLSFHSEMYEIDAVYGCTNSETNTKSIVHVHTMIASAMNKKGIKGGLILLKLKKKPQNEKVATGSPQKNEVKLILSYEIVPHSFYSKYNITAPEQGKRMKKEISIDVSDLNEENVKSSFYSDLDIRKGILLSKYTDLLKRISTFKNLENLKKNQEIIQEMKEFVDEIATEQKVIGDKQLSSQAEIIHNFLKDNKKTK